MTPALVLLAAVLLPLLDRSSRRIRYVELPTRHPLRTGATWGVVSFFVVASAAGYHDTLGVPPWGFGVLLIAVPVLLTLALWAALRRFTNR